MPNFNKITVIKLCDLFTESWYEKIFNYETIVITQQYIMVLFIYIGHTRERGMCGLQLIYMGFHTKALEVIPNEITNKF